MDDVRLDGVVPNSPSCDLTNEEEEGNPQPPKEGDSNRACTSQTAWTTEEEIALAKGWRFISENNECCNARKKDGFWVVVLEYLMSKTKQEGRRTSKASGSSTMNDDALARLMVTEMTAAKVAQREKFMKLKRRKVECREREIAAAEYRAQQEDMRLYLQPYEHLTGEQRLAIDAIRAQIKAKYNL
ncbi:hypothetical protein Tco_1338553 [Tanacetum coccineum]